MQSCDRERDQRSRPVMQVLTEHPPERQCDRQMQVPEEQREQSCPIGARDQRSSQKPDGRCDRKMQVPKEHEPHTGRCSYEMQSCDRQMQKRKLTHTDFIYLTDFLEDDKKYPIQLETVNNIRLKIYKQLERVEIYPCLIPKLKEQLKKRFIRSRLHANDMVGVLASASMGQPLTQLVLNSFHLSGVLNVTSTSGVPRIEEILSLTKNQKSRNMKGKFIDSIQKLPLKEIFRYGKKLEHQNWDKMIDGTKLMNIQESKKDWDPFKYEWNRKFNIFTIDQSKDEKGVNMEFDYKIISDFYLNLKINKLNMYKYDHTPLSMALLLQKQFSELVFIPSPIKHYEIDIHFDVTSGIEHPEGEDQYKHFFLNFLLKLLKDFSFGGITQITQVIVKNDGFETIGSNLFDMMQNESIKTVTTNDIWEVNKVLGIEAAKNTIISEILNVFESGGTGLNLRHVTLLVDAMTHKGILCPVSRYGIDRKETGPFAKASFEQALDNFLIAGIKGEKDDLTGVSSKIMLGKLASAGTGEVHLYTDVLKELWYSKQRSGEDLWSSRDDNVISSVQENEELIIEIEEN